MGWKRNQNKMKTLELSFSLLYIQMYTGRKRTHKNESQEARRLSTPKSPIMVFNKCVGVCCRIYIIKIIIHDVHSS